MNEIRYPIVIHSDPDGLTVEVPDFDIVTEGDATEECLRMAQEVFDGGIRVSIDNRFPIPRPSRVEGKNVFYISPDPRLQAGLMLRFTREDQNLSQEEFAKRLGIKQRTYSDMENLKRTNLTMRTLGRLVKNLDRNVVIRFENLQAEHKKSR